jgi:GNAT superfamily N-acetyltransferase
MLVLGGAMSVGYVVDLAKKHTDAIGFIPRPRLERYAECGQMALEYENGEPCGFLVWGNGWPVLKIYQACIQYDARRLEHGAALVARVEREAVRRGCSAVSLWCASDLEANLFWDAVGYRAAATKQGGERRGRKLIRWVKALPQPLQPALESACPSSLPRSAPSTSGAWRGRCG